MIKDICKGALFTLCVLIIVPFIVVILVKYLRWLEVMVLQ
jgi:hypothetical protein